jgi:4-amino-4-deoxy-L-arabinose transferase-like glycosyltransferase
MTSNTLFYKPTRVDYSNRLTRKSLSKQRWLSLLAWITVLALFVIGAWMRLHLLNVPYDRDSYDEGVYWQSLRSMSTGASLYQQIFYSQPPFFLLAIYPFYALLGQTLWSARLGIAIISLFGFVGALLLGKALAGRLGMLLALLLLVINPLYLAESQILQADGPSTALTLLAVGLAYLWWERPDGMAGYCLATLVAFTLALSILTKLLVVPALAPVGLLVLARFWQLKQQALVKLFFSICPILLGCIFFILTTVLLFLPFIHTLPQMWHMVVSFHTDAKTNLLISSSKAKSYNLDTQQNTTLIQNVLVSLLGASALYGTIAALLQRNWRVIPLLAWLAATIYVFWQQVPLLSHHMVAVIPPLIGLSVMGVAPITHTGKRLRILMGRSLRLFPLKIAFANKKLAFLKTVFKAPDPLANLTMVLAIMLVLCQVVINFQAIRSFYDTSYLNAHSQATQSDLHVAHDLQQVTKQDQLVITDAQFIVAQAGRNTPASLVDTSNVRIFTGYVMTQQLIEAASQPQVQAVLFYHDRLDLMRPSFYNWVCQHFHLAHHYGNKEELWVKN